MCGKREQYFPTDQWQRGLNLHNATPLARMSCTLFEKPKQEAPAR